MLDSNMIKVEKPLGLEVKTCPYCSHRSVCAIYDAFMEADIKANDYNVLNPGYDDKIYEVLAGNCNSFAQ